MLFHDPNYFNTWTPTEEEHICLNE